MPADGKSPPDEKPETKDRLAVWRRVRCHNLHVARRRGFPGAKTGGKKLNPKAVKKTDLVMLVTLALLTAMNVVLTRFLGIQTPLVQINFSFVPVVLAALLYGPIPAAVVGGLGDFLGAILFPAGAYFPGFTLTAVLAGLVYGFFLYRKQAALWRAIAAVLLITVVLNMGLNTLWLWILMKDGVWGILSTRIPKYFLVAPVQILVTRALSGRLTEQFRRLIAA